MLIKLEKIDGNFLLVFQACKMRTCNFVNIFVIFFFTLAPESALFSNYIAELVVAKNEIRLKKKF